MKQYECSVELSLLRYTEGLSTYQSVIGSNPAARSPRLSYRDWWPPNLIATYKALGGGWELRQGRDLVPSETQEQIQQRTDWGDLLSPQDFLDELPQPSTGQEIKIFNKPDF